MKNDYFRVIESIGMMDTLKNHHNRLNTIWAKTIDNELKKLLEVAKTKLFQASNIAKQSKKSSVDIRLDMNSDYLRTLIEYCETKK